MRKASLKLHSYHGRAINEQLGTGWFMNVGPTGLRARITHDHPAYFTIKFVFEDSPTAGKIKAGDIEPTTLERVWSYRSCNPLNSAHAVHNHYRI